MAQSTKQPDWLVAGALAWIIPGLGHIYLGKIKRGVILFVAIAALFYTGLGIGGVMTVDYHNERYWFYAQMGSGVHGLLGWYRQDQVYQDIEKNEGITPQPFTNPGQIEALQMQFDQALVKRGIAVSYPEDNIARAYTGVAGMLNALCVFDAAVLALAMAAAAKEEKADKPAKAKGAKA